MTEDPKKYLKEGERIDSVQRDGLSIIQDPSKFCFGMDAVLLSAFVRANEGERILDLCTGNGIIPILLYAKTKGTSITGLEIQEEIAEMAARSVAMNGIGDRVSIEAGDLKDASKIFGASSFDIVTSNPPYMSKSHGIPNKDSAKYIARHEEKCTLHDLVLETAKLLKPKGRCYFVHRPLRLVELFSEMHKYGIEPKRMRLVYPYYDREANMVLVEGIRGAKPELRTEKPLIIYKEANIYSDEVISIYND